MLGKTISDDFIQDYIDAFDIDANDRIISHIGLVISIAKRFFKFAERKRGAEDILQSAMCGILHADKHFNENLGLRFSTYASHCVRGYILRFLNTGQSVENYYPYQTISQSTEKAYRDDQFYKLCQKELVSDLLSRLDPLERTVIKHRYCLEGKTHLTLNALGKKLKLSSERIRQIQEKAEQKMKFKFGKYQT